MDSTTSSSLNATWSLDAAGICNRFAAQDGAALVPMPGWRLPAWIAAHSPDGSAVAPLVERALAARLPFSHELRIGRAEPRHAILFGVPTEDGYTGALTDIGAQQAALDAATRSAAEHRLIVENSDDLIAHCGPDGRYLHISPAYTRLMGWTPEQMIGRRVVDFLHPDDQAPAQAALEQLFAGAPPLEAAEVRKRDAAGNHVSLGTKAWPVTDPATGQVTGAVLISRDITREQELRRRLADMADEKLALVESIDDGFFSVNAQWEITYANKRAADFAGVDRDSSIGRPVWEVAKGLAESAVGAHMRAAMARGESMSFEEFYEPNGVWVSERIYAYKGGLSVFFHDITERKLAEAKLEALATRDSLTGLPNRAWINEQVAAMLAHPACHGGTTVFFIDLNRFKEINDSLGHATGDVLLQQVSTRLQSCMRPGDVVARLGGDEFVVAAHCAGREAAGAIAQRLLNALKTPFHADGLEMCVGASIGISQAEAGSATAAQLFENADTAMYKAKAQGNGSYRFFEPEMSTEAKRRLQVEMALNRALERDEFEVVYQPRVDLATMRVVGMEALLRWRHPELGNVPPLEFIPLAEDRGHIDAIGSWVLRQACATVARLNAEHDGALRVSVNVSARQLRSPAFVDDVLAALAAAQVHPDALELELTESALIVDVAQSAALLTRLKAAGVRLSLDDFGTGYSSLSYLKRFPVDVLKLDRSFVTGEGSDVDFVAALIGMAHALDLSVVAEGIETEALAHQLRGIACDEGQGYWFARPLPLAAFEAYLSEGRFALAD